MKFLLEIEIGNDAMQTVDQVADAVKHVARKMEKELPAGEPTSTEQTVFDANGNRVGWWTFTEGWSVREDKERRR